VPLPAPDSIRLTYQIAAAKVAYSIEEYEPDTILLLGTSLYAQPDVERAARRLVGSIRVVNR
jgi:hypothetical protein